MKRISNGLAVVCLLAAATSSAFGSSHREALAILNEPCADNTDTFAWVSDTAHDKLYLVMDFYPLHEPGQGNHGLRACNGYRYEFHIGMGTSLADRYVYRIEFNNTLPASSAPTPADKVGGSNEILWQLTGGTETMTVSRLTYDANGKLLGHDILGRDLPVLPNNHGPQTDRLVYGIGAFQGYDSKDPTSRNVGLYDQNFIDKYIQNLSNGGRVIAGQFDDPYQLDEKGIFDLVNLNTKDLGGIPGARSAPARDVFTGFNVFSIVMEVPTSEMFPNGIPHNNSNILNGNLTDTLLRIWARIMRQKNQTVDTTNPITGLKGSGEWVQVGRNALPLFDAGFVGASSQTLYLHSSPMKDVTNFGAFILYPVLVRDAQALGIYKALGLPDATVTTLKGPRMDIINAINLGRPIPVADGSTGDVLTLDASIDSKFPNGRRLGGGAQPNMHQVNVNSVLLSLICAGDPNAGLFKGVEVNDKDFVNRFPFISPANQGLYQGHGGVNTPTQPVIPIPQ
jgi:YD repeat-containing protein